MADNVFTLKYLEEIDNYSDKIDIDELYHGKIKSEKIKLDVYNRLLARVHKKIKLTSRQKIDDQFCCFIVPETMLGIPKYNQTDCIHFLMEKLNKNNFIVKYIHPNCLFISWKHWIPNYVRDEFKKKTGISIDGNGYILNSHENNNEENHKMLTYDNKKTNTNTLQNNVYRSTEQLNNEKILYKDGILEKLQSIISKVNDK
jgi:hypothetical protein